MRHAWAARGRAAVGKTVCASAWRSEFYAMAGMVCSVFRLFQSDLVRFSVSNMPYEFTVLL
jgi:hypothetical protein